MERHDISFRDRILHISILGTHWAAIIYRSQVHDQEWIMDFIVITSLGLGEELNSVYERTV
jgi:hypothetical protein